MNKSRVNLGLDLTIGLAFLAEAISGFVLWFALPHVGFQGGRGLGVASTFLLSRTAWLAIHDWAAVLISAGILAHVALHWSWIKCVVRNLWRDAFPRATVPTTLGTLTGLDAKGPN